jgi:hypothetical protein
MMNELSSNTLSISSRKFGTCAKDAAAIVGKCNVVLLEPTMVPRSKKESILRAAGYCVTTVSDVRTMFLLRAETAVAFVVLNDLLGPYSLRAAAELARGRWPRAKILVLGCAVPVLEDNLYDEVLAHRYEATAFIEVLQMLAKDFWEQKLTAGYPGHWRTAALQHESDLAEDSCSEEVRMTSLLDVLAEHFDNAPNA